MKFLGIPISHEFKIVGNPKTVSAIGIDKSGSRLLTACTDYFVRYWDFNGMSKSTKWFRELEALPSNIVKRIEFSSDSNEVMFLGPTPVIKIADRDGREIAESVIGFGYVREMSITRGHIS